MGNLNLIDAMGLEFGSGKRWLRRALIANGCLYVVALLGIFGSGWMTKTAAVLTLVVQGAVFLCRSRMSKSYGLGEKIRRLAMFRDGLGIEPSAKDITIVATRLGFPDSRGRSFVGDYYAATAPVGQKRLLQIIDECVYWTAQGAEETRKFLLTCLVLASALVLMAFVISVQAGISNEKTVKVFISTVSVIAVGELAGLVTRFSSLSKVADEMLLRAEGLFQKSQIGEQPLILAGEYNCALASAGTPIPTWIYRRNQDRWNAAYAERRRSLQGEAQGIGA